MYTIYVTEWTVAFKFRVIECKFHINAYKFRGIDWKFHINGYTFRGID